MYALLVSLAPPDALSQASPLVRTACHVVEAAGGLVLAALPGALWGYIGRRTRLAARQAQEGRHDDHGDA